MPGGQVRLQLILQGRVQGVGLRPFVRGLARERGLSGWVRNRGDQVALEVQGPPSALEAFIQDLLHHPPPGMRVENLGRRTVSPQPAEAGFRILESGPGTLTRGPGVDRAVCDDCLAELFDPGNRRHRHPFIHCTHCGPRYTLITGLPYDRARTTQADFPLCAACAAEYADPGGRRCHAQTLCCPDCGPRLRLWDAHGLDIPCEDPVGTAVARLADGAVPPMEVGFLDGTNASLLERGMASPLGVGVFITPVHAQAPDVEAAVRLVDTVNDTYDLGVDSDPLTSFAAEIRKHYEGLAERMEEAEPDGSYDRMYM
ncbi:MAG: acylphosphatase [Ectothiorhodospira sp.]